MPRKSAPKHPTTQPEGLLSEELLHQPKPPTPPEHEVVRPHTPIVFDLSLPSSAAGPARAVLLDVLIDDIKVMEVTPSSRAIRERLLKVLAGLKEKRSFDQDVLIDNLTRAATFLAKVQSFVFAREKALNEQLGTAFVRDLTTLINNADDAIDDARAMFNAT